ncbi:lipoprotein N-acyltransferase Lnb domain-containing protein [Flavobacterium sp. ARAG 55.4]|uniref:lipoprotein N-acyltransferase Lnb domain-containing protein n=1 Tax=Flavobacterium sp. ARAG 55.4 TaxID=3451357 RepID=UPI003F479E9C
MAHIPFLKKITLLLFFISLVNAVSAQNIQLSGEAAVSVITCGTGNESYSLFGHTAIRIKDPVNFVDAVYNYGAFDFSTPNFVPKFAKGDLQYFAVVNRYTDFISQYAYDRRSVEEQELQIPLELKQQLFENLNTSLASGDSHYTYKFIDKNCTSMVVDLINKTLGNIVITKKTDTELTYRTILYPYFNHHFYEKLGTSIIFGTKVDEPGTKLFLPIELQKSLAVTTYKNKALAPENKTILNFEPSHLFSWWNNIYTYLIFTALLVILNKRMIHLSFFTIMGFLGLFFIFMGFYSNHLELANNYNVLLFNPALLVLAVFYSLKNKVWSYRLAVFNLISIGIYVVILLNKVHLFIVLPLVVTSVYFLIQLILKKRTVPKIK